MGSRHLFTSESVTEGHPDKIADQISDAVVDAMLAQDPMSRVACETLVTTGMAFVAGEVTSRAYVEIPELVRKVIGEIGYDSAEFGFDSNTCAVMTTLDAQSPDIAMGVDRGGAGDQGLMFGYACRETKELMPLPITLAHKMTQRLSRMRRNGRMKYLRPDGKSQVTVEYDDAGHPVRVDTVVISSQHAANVSQKRIHRDVIKNVIMPVIPKRLIDKSKPIKFHINPTGQFIQGGPMADSGLTGRKIIVDTYGGVGSHGGGAFSGKDPSKVDRSASYGARWVAKNLVASGLCERAEVQIAYAIGKAQPVSIMVDSKGTGEVDDDKLTRAVRRVFDLTPKGLIKELKLRRPIFRKTAAYGHFGRNEPEFLWERTNKARALRRAV